MRIHPIGTAALFAAACVTLPATAFAANGTSTGALDTTTLQFEDAPPAESAPPEDEVVLDDEVEGAGGDPPADAPPNTGFLDDGDGAEGAAPPTGEADTGPAITPAEQAKLDQKNITVVQRQSFLNVYRKDGDPKGKMVHRIELQPVVGLSINDPFVRHYAIGGALDFWLTNRMAVGLTGTGFIGNTTAAYDRIRFQNGQLLTANRNLWEASATFTYEPFYGKIAVFNKALMHWEAFTQIGGGVLQTEVIPRFAAINEPFRNFTGGGNFAIGARFHVQGLDFMSFNFSVRTWVFPDKYEPSARGPVIGSAGVVNNPELDDPEAAKKAAETVVSFTAAVFFGVSFYIPPTFKYSTRR